MDSLKTLLDRQQYDLVIKLTESSKEANDIFYRVAAFTLLGKYEDALYVIQDNQDILEKSNLNSLITVHVELLCSLERYEQARSAYDYYSNLPYQSQIVEETLRKIPELINQEEHKRTSGSKFSEDDIFEKLASNKGEDVILALDLIKKLDIFTYLPEIQKVMIKNEKQMVRSFALMLLVEKEVDRELDYLSYKGLIKVNPKNLVKPFSGALFNNTARMLSTKVKDTTVIQNSVQLLSNYVIFTYPLCNDYNSDDMTDALIKMSEKLMDDSADISSLNNESKALFDIIDAAINDF